MRSHLTRLSKSSLRASSLNEFKEAPNCLERIHRMRIRNRPISVGSVNGRPADRSSRQLVVTASREDPEGRRHALIRRRPRGVRASLREPCDQFTTVLVGRLRRSRLIILRADVSANSVTLAQRHPNLRSAVVTPVVRTA